MPFLITHHKAITLNSQLLYLFVGASPKLHGSRQVNKPEFANQNWDIARSGPAALHIGLNKPQYNLESVDGPNCVKFTTTRLGGDPLNPSYKLSKVE